MMIRDAFLSIVKTYYGQVYLSCSFKNLWFKKGKSFFPSIFPLTGLLSSARINVVIELVKPYTH